ncbi:MAG: methylenetetrahydrofolate reductase, partial [Planctomycetota bacterium]
VHKLQVYADLVSSGNVDLLALGDGPRGRDTLDNAIAAALLIGLGADPARLMANIVARGRQADQIRGRLLHFAELGVRNALLLTGDLPVGSRQAGPPARPARFPLDSVGMCELARKMLLEGALPDDFWIAAAGHPNPDADPDGLRTLQKALAGAKVIITQAIYSVEQFTQWMQALHRLGALDQVHVLAEVIPITSASQLRLIADVPGIRVPGDLIAELDAAKERLEQAATAGGHPPEWVEQRLRNEGARITRGLLHRIRKVPGVSGFYLGCVKGFEAHLELLREAPLLPEQGQGLHKVTKIAGAERQRALANLPSLESFLYALVRQAHRRQRRSRFAGRVVDRGWVQGLVKLLEWPKVPLFGCKKCDRCDLSSDALICPRGCA